MDNNQRDKRADNNIGDDGKGYDGANLNHIFDGDAPKQNIQGTGSWSNDVYFMPDRKEPKESGGVSNRDIDSPRGQPTGGGYGGYSNNYGKTLYRENAGSGKFVKAFVGIFIAIIFFGLGFLSGYFGAVSEEEKLARWIKNTVANNFYDGDTTEFDFTKAIGNAMVGAVDEFSSFYTPEETLLLEQEDEGNYINSGLHLFDTDTLSYYEYTADQKDTGIDTDALVRGSLGENKVFAFKVYGDSPAYKAGIRAGDVLIKIEGRSVAGMDVSAANSDIAKVFANSSVANLTFERGSQTIEAALTRAEYNPVYSYYRDNNTPGYEQLPDNAAVITFEEFAKYADIQFANNMQKFYTQNKEVLILDLRTNFGGTLDSLQRMAVHLIADSSGNSYDIPITIARYKNGSMSINSAGVPEAELSYADYGFKKIIVLANFYSASATELLISAMNDYSTIDVLVGKRTFGKAVMQGRFSYGDYRMYLTIAKLYSVKDTNFSYNKQGFSPDINVAFNLSGDALDAQMQQAIEAAKNVNTDTVGA